MKIKRSLRSKLTGLSVIPALVLAVILVVFYFFSMFNSGVSSYNEEGTSLAKAYASSVVNYMDALEQQFTPVIRNAGIVDESIVMETRKKQLANAAETSTFKDFSIAYSDGKTYSNTDISQRDYFKQAMAEKGAYVSSPVIRMTDNSVTIMMGKYFTQKNKDYLVYGGLDEKTFSNIIDDVHFGSGGIAFIMDKNGEIVGSSTPGIALMTDMDGDNSFDSTLKNAAAEMTASEEGNVRFSYGGEEYLAGYAHISSAENWAVVVATPLAALKSSIITSCVIIAVVALVLMLGTIFITNIRVRQIAGPIAATSKRLGEMAQGDLTSPAQVFKTGDEIEIMTISMQEMASNMGKYITDIRGVLTAVAKGDLTRHTGVEYQGDFKEIQDSMENIVDSLNSVLTNVSSSSVEVHKGATQLAAGSSGLSSGAISQASAVEQVTSTVQTMAQKTAENEQSVRQALEIADNTDIQAHNGAKSMAEMLDAIGEIESSAKEIGKIIKVIEDISFQTNILALNASVEAARAGAAGKGFSVVAGEVRNLANKSKEAANQTNSLITQSINAVAKGTQLANTTSDALHEIVEGVDKVSGAIKGIAKFNDEQNIAVKQISQAMESVNQAIHNTTATAEESAAESEELSSLAGSLSSAVSHFKLGSR